MNYFEDLWKKAAKKRVSKFRLGVAIFGKKYYRYIYAQGRPTKRALEMYKRIDETIDKLAKEK